MAKQKKKTKLWVKILIAILVILLLLMMCVVAAVEYVLGKIGSAVPTDPIEVIPPEMEFFETDPTQAPQVTTAPTVETTVSTDPTADTTEPTVEPTVPPTSAPAIDWPTMEEFVDDQVINILLVGQDANVASGRTRSDTMILLSINKRNNTICLTSFMRDLYVDFPGGYSDNRLNAAYAFGGAPLLNETLNLNFGINIDGNVAVGFDQFQKIIDVLGGVDVYINQYEAQYMNSQGHKTIHEGTNHLDGKLALAFCRIRKIDSDHSRTERQRRVLTAIAQRAKSADVGTVLAMINEVLPYVSTDLSDSQIISYATSALSILANGSVKSGKVPQSGDYTAEFIRGMQVMVPNIWRCYEYIKEFIYS